jgi:hypothetical protein
MPETLVPQATLPLGDERLSERDRRLAEAGVRIPAGPAPPLAFAGRRRPAWLAAIIRLFT